MKPLSSSGMAICLSLLGCLAGACASSPDATGRWSASTSNDPITGVERCVVTIPDRRFGSAFSRTGVVYPFVEKNSELGLMVGVSSGGQIRLPTGDIEWRVDNNPHHTLRVSSPHSMGHFEVGFLGLADACRAPDAAGHDYIV